MHRLLINTHTVIYLINLLPGHITCCKLSYCFHSIDVIKRHFIDNCIDPFGRGKHSFSFFATNQGKKLFLQNAKTEHFDYDANIKNIDYN